MQSKTDFNCRSRKSWNVFLKKYNMQLNASSVISTSFRKYLHPKETLVEDGVVSKEFLSLLDQESTHQASQPTIPGLK